MGYEDFSDHDQLRQDPLLAVRSGKRELGEETLAGKSTLNRLELSAQPPSRYKKVHCRPEATDDLLTTVFVEAHGAPPERVVLDLDVTGLPLRGHQEGRFFHGYYDEYCYLPLYIFAGEHLLCARLRTADPDASTGSREEVEPIVGRLRAAWPAVEIILLYQTTTGRRSRARPKGAPGQGRTDRGQGESPPGGDEPERGAVADPVIV